MCMTTAEQVYTKAEVPKVSEEALERGRQFVNSLDALRQSIQGVQLGYEHGLDYYFVPKSGQYMVVIPSKPIDIRLLSFKYHKGAEIHETSTTTEPFVVSRLHINGLTDYRGEQSSLEFVGQSPSWKSDNGYVAHLWSEEYTFNPLEHQVAIVDDTQQPN